MSICALLAPFRQQCLLVFKMPYYFLFNYFRYTQKLEATCFEASAFRQSVLHLMSGFVAYMESDSRSIEKDGTLVGERRNHVARLVLVPCPNDQLYLDESNSFSNY